MSEVIEKSGFPLIPFTTFRENQLSHLAYLQMYGTNWPFTEILVWAETHIKLIEGHGTRTLYQKRCRCVLCCEAQSRYENVRRVEHNDYKKRWRKRRKEEQIRMQLDLEGVDGL